MLLEPNLGTQWVWVSDFERYFCQWHLRGQGLGTHFCLSKRFFQLQKSFMLFSKKTGVSDIINSHGNIWMRVWKDNCSSVGQEQTDNSTLS